jgi:cellulose synthase/poly-beta-1,6-N-acetylglucosamine synthase-like glycosyltransferase
MQTVISLMLLLLTVALAVPTFTFFVEILAAFLRQPKPAQLIRDPNARLAVLVPARNESEGILATLESIQAQLRPQDRVVVIADNCTDDTADIARAVGATVVERHDTARIGKGYALDFGLQSLKTSSPEVVIIVDADCQLSPGTLEQLTATSLASNRPVQALYLMTSPADATVNQKVAEFAWRVKNWVRPLGLHNFGLPCQLMGTGMAFPWKVIESADLANGSIVEDLKLGLDLAEANCAPVFCPSARVLSQFAATKRGEDTQRQRWEHGHINTILRQAPSLLLKALAKHNLNLLALTLDLAVPPLSLLAMLLVLSFVVTSGCALLGAALAAFIVSAGSLIAFVFAACLAWHRFGREVLPPSAIASIPFYVLRKIGLYRQALFGKVTTRWIGTDRAKM